MPSPTPTLVLKLLYFWAVFLAKLTAADSQFLISVVDIYVGDTRNQINDNPVLVISSTTGGVIDNSTYVLPTVQQYKEISSDALTQSITVPDGADLSVAIGIVTVPTEAEEIAKATADFLEAIASIARFAPGPYGRFASFLNTALHIFGGFLDCDGPAVADNAQFSASDLGGLQSDIAYCSQYTSVFDSPSILCGIDPSSYTVTYCIQRLDDQASVITSVQSTTSVAAETTTQSPDPVTTSDTATAIDQTTTVDQTITQTDEATLTPTTTDPASAKTTTDAASAQPSTDGTFDQTTTTSQSPYQTTAAASSSPPYQTVQGAAAWQSSWSISGLVIATLASIFIVAL